MAGRRLLLGLLVAASAQVVALGFASGAARAQSIGAPATPPPALPPMPPLRLARGITELPQGAWRIAFAPDQDTLDAEQRAALGRLGAALHTSTIGRILLNSEASRGEDVSTHRRTSLARARAVKAALVAGGLDETRVDLRALGRTEQARDVVEVLSPTAPR